MVNTDHSKHLVINKWVAKSLQITIMISIFAEVTWNRLYNCNLLKA